MEPDQRDRMLDAIARGRALVAASAAILERTDARLHPARVPQAARRRAPDTAAAFRKELRWELAVTATRLADAEEVAARMYTDLAARDPARAERHRQAAARARDVARRARQAAGEFAR